MRLLITLAIIGMLAGGTAGAQEQEPQTPPQPEPAAPTEQQPQEEPKEQTPPSEKQEEKAAEQTGEEEDAEEAARIETLFVEAGWMDWGLSDNGRRFRQYATPPKGLFLRELTYLPYSATQGNLGRFTLRGLSVSEEDYLADARLALLYGTTQFEGTLARSSFYFGTPNLIPESGRRITEGYARQLIGQNFGISTRYREDRQDQVLDIPLQPILQRTRYADFIAAGRVGPGFLNLTYSQWRLGDRTGFLRNTKTDRYRASYLWEASRNIGAEVNYSRYNIRQTAIGPEEGILGGGVRRGVISSDSKIDTVSFLGDITLGQMTDASVVLRQDKIDYPIVQNSYVREQRSGTLRVAHRWDRWNAQVAYHNRQVERLRGDQLVLQKPAWNTFEGRLTGRLTPEVRVSLRGMRESLSKKPQMITNDPRPLMWDSRDQAQFRLEGGNAFASGYFTWNYRRWNIDPRSVYVTMNGFILGGNYQATPAVALFAEFSRENWSGRRDIDGVDFPRIGAFLPDAQVFAAGANWVVNPQAFVTLNYTGFSTRNENPLRLRDGSTRGNLLTLQGRYTLPGGQELGLIVAPWNYKDRVVTQMDYDATVIALTGSTKY